ncbi:tryptophan synthase subunit alpha [Bacteroidota bacterium]
MMRLDKLFQNKQKNILSVFFTAGYPELWDTVKIITALEKYGADIVEIGMPFSDPIADGPVIQKSNQIALNNGMSIDLLFNQLKDIRKRVQIPLILMGYLNPVLQFGFEKFCNKAAEVGIDGLILPDLPLKEYQEKYKAIIQSFNLHTIFLFSPKTSDERIQLIDNEGSGFNYFVSSSSTTGAKDSFSEEQIQYFEKIKSLQLKNPKLIGFGISNNETFKTACKYAHGAIIGSAFIKSLEENGILEDKIEKFVRCIIK